MADIETEVLAYPNVAALRERTGWSKPSPVPELLIPYRLDLGAIELSMFTTLTTFGTPRDITLDEIAVELFFPNDPATTDYFEHIATLAIERNR